MAGWVADSVGRRRVIALVVALALEALLILALLTLSRASPPPGRPAAAVTTFDVSVAPKPPQSPPKEQPSEQAPPEADRSPPQAAAPRPAETVTAPPIRAAPPVPAPPVPLPLPPINLPVPRPVPAPAQPAPPSRPQPSAAPAAKAGVAQGPMQGPTLGARDRGRAADSEVVGTAPNGQPLYAAAWYREPYDRELAGYLSTATGPGWGLIACRTVADYRVEDCVALDESPQGSNINRAVLAAAWQFKVRPPRVGGKSLVGSWVRIRIDYVQGKVRT